MSANKTDQSWRATDRQMACAHTNFRAAVVVNRLEDTGRFMADVTIACAECELPFHFIGCQAGLDWERPMVSIGGNELRAPIAPGLDVPWAALERSR